jgi:hypothetical protein
VNDEPSWYRRHFEDPKRERGFWSALGFTTAFATARAITHAIKDESGPFWKTSGGGMSVGGTHIHHSTFGIFGLLGVGYVWVYRWGIGNHPPESRWASRATAAAYGVASALTLDEFALWLDLKDDYWSKEGRKSVDAVALFGGLLAMTVAGRSVLKDTGLVPEALERFF